MTDPDRMVPVGTPERDVDGIEITVLRDYDHAIVFGYRLDAGLVEWLRGRLTEWENERDAYLGRSGDQCASHGGEGDGWPGCPGCADEGRRERCELVTARLGTSCTEPAVTRLTGTCAHGHVTERLVCEGHKTPGKPLWCRACYRLPEPDGHECPVDLAREGAVAAPAAREAAAG